MRIDFVSDVACPWCAIGLNSLERALERIGGDIGEVELHMQPFELNPTMGPEGEDASEYLTSKYGLSPEQFAANRARIVERGVAEGFEFGPRTRIWNTFDAHRLLFWAGAEGPPGGQRALKHALITAYHGQGRNPGAHDVLLELAGEAGLDLTRAREVLEHGEFAEEVRQAERFWQELGINGVPAVIINRKHLISGGQPHEVFERALREIAAETDDAAAG
ncbi:MAG TPA: DsbA family oxidoreductase [Gammaproteobacteria bacterium]|nr:DsbA family oxidoreductase [Gammaproteobacteria bacterium]